MDIEYSARRKALDAERIVEAITSVVSTNSRKYRVLEVAPVAYTSGHAMKETIDWAQQQAIEWIGQYGYGAVVPALLLDPGGVPWPWICLMLLAEEAGKNIFLMIALGFGALSVCDHVLYGLGRFGRPLLQKIEVRWPQTADILHQSEDAIRKNGAWAIPLGRFLPFLGRWVGLGAGLAGVAWARFAILNSFGIFLTVAAFGAAAHFVGRKTINAPWFPQALFIAFVGGTVVTLGGAALGAWHSRRKNRKAAQIKAQTEAPVESVEML